MRKLREDANKKRVSLLYPGRFRLATESADVVTGGDGILFSFSSVNLEPERIKKSCGVRHHPSAVTTA